MNESANVSGDRIVMTVKTMFHGPANDEAHLAERVKMMDEAKAMRRMLAERIGETLALDHPVGTMAHFDVSLDDLRELNALRAVAREFSRHAADLAGRVGDDELRDYLTDFLTRIDGTFAEEISDPHGDGNRVYTFQYPRQEQE